MDVENQTPATTDPPATTGKTFTQDDINRIAADVRAEEKRKHDAALKAAADEAAVKEAEKQGEFKTLADQRAERIKELEPLEAERTAITAERDSALSVVQRIVTAKIKTAPPDVVALLTSTDAADNPRFSLTEQLDYIEKHEGEWGKRQSLTPVERDAGHTTSQNAGQAYLNSRYRRGDKRKTATG